MHEYTRDQKSLGKGSENLFCKWPDNKYAKLCEPGDKTEDTV